MSTGSPSQTPGEESFSARGPEDHGELTSDALQDYRQGYGLSRDPFGTDPYYPFFSGGQRGELLEQIIHLCQFGQGVTVVVGERGVGKTRLALALYESLDQSQVCFITALPTLQADVLLQHIATHAGFETTGATTGQLISALTDPQNFSGEQDFSLIIIDDAHHLDDETISALLRLTRSPDAEHQKFQAVLTGDATLVERLRNLPVIPVQINDYYLLPFTLAETVDYLGFRMEMADYLGPEIFTANLVTAWWREAQGRLPVVHNKARDYLLSTTRPEARESAKNFPVVHIVTAAALGCAILMAILYRGGSDATEPPRTQRIPLNLQAVSSSSVLSSASSSVLLPPPVVVEERVTDLPLPAAASSEASLAASSLSASSVVSVTMASSSSSQSSQLQSSLAQSSAAPPPAAVPPVDTLSADEQTLMSWNSGDYTLQLLGVSNHKAAVDFIAAQPNRDDLLLFRSSRQGKDWFVVVVGRYQNSAEARAAISGLPEVQSKAGPWPRTLRDVQQELQQRH